LTWATYYDAADEAGLSRLYGGIHVRADDFAGRIMGASIGKAAFEKANRHFHGNTAPLTPLNSYEKWGELLAHEFPNYTKPGDSIPGSNFSNLERFVFGFGPREIAAQTDRIASADFNFESQLIEYKSEILYGSEVNLVFQTSENLKNWQNIPLEEVAESAESSTQGKVVYLFSTNHAALDGKSKFIRLSVPND
ncbi:MAG: hypothetical protein AAGB46_04665, partial [Verrucomicrobiota bacterium]